ncbi:hypothetical protein O0L34_g4187 [Tuta absoluta]|nr:hypothetical protein O0L34_g4187 [Tuta absoluta]
MFALHSRRLRRRLSAPTSGSARRRARERKRAEQTRAEGERLARERREQRAMEKVEQQRIARQQLASYEPWGRAGGGAPNAHGVRYTKIRNTGIFPEDELRGVCQYEACRRWPSPGRRRRRTPLRLREDPQLLYAETLRKSVDNDIRYRQTPDQQRSYKEILDDMVDKRHKAMKDEKKRDRDYERKMQALDGPWGKPGPGGTTWRNPRDIGLNFSKSMGWTDNEIFDKLQGDHRRYKRSSLTLPKVKRVDDAKEESSDKENIKPSTVEKLPEIKQASSPKNNNAGRKVSAEDKETQKSETKKKTKKAPKKSKFVKRLSNGERLQRIVPEDDSSDDINNNKCDSNGVSVNGVEKKLTPEATILRVTGGVELVPLLARRRRIGARTLPSTDVTRPSDEHCQWREMDYVDYLRDLKHQMQVKYQRKEESRKDSAESVRKHHATWASLWGKPGHGAPLRGRYARSNLAQLLYVAPLANPAQ